MFSSMQFEIQPHLSSRRQTPQLQVGEGFTSVSKSDDRLWLPMQQINGHVELPSSTGAKRSRDETEERPRKRVCTDLSAVEQYGAFSQYDMLPIGTALSASNYEPSYFFTHASHFDQVSREIVTACPPAMTVTPIQSLPEPVFAQFKTDVTSVHSTAMIDTFDADMAFLKSLSTERFRELMEIIQENEEASMTLESSKSVCASRPPIQTIVADDDSLETEALSEGGSVSTCDSFSSAGSQFSKSPTPEASFDERYAEAIKFWTGAPLKFTLLRM